MDETPASDGPVEGGAWVGCATQRTITYNGNSKRDHGTCTSCKPGYAFMMIYHDSRAGSCHPYETEARIKCVQANDDEPYISLESSAKICTKVSDHLGTMAGKQARAP